MTASILGGEDRQSSQLLRRDYSSSSCSSVSSSSSSSSSLVLPPGRNDSNNSLGASIKGSSGCGLLIVLLLGGMCPHSIRCNQRVLRMRQGDRSWRNRHTCVETSGHYSEPADFLVHAVEYTLEFF